MANILDGSTYRERCISSRCDFAIADRMHDARVGAGPVSALKDPAQSQAAMSRSETSTLTVCQTARNCSDATVVGDWPRSSLR